MTEKQRKTRTLRKRKTPIENLAEIHVADRRLQCGMNCITVLLCE